MTRKSCIAVLFSLSLLLLACAQAAPTPTTERVTFNTTDGLKLDGHLLGRGAVGVVLAHAVDGDQTSWQDFAQKLSKEGYQTLRFDFRGYGNSEGSKTDAANIDMDVAAALRFLKDRGASKVFLIGAGMGGTASIKVAALEEVAGVVTLSAPGEFQGLNALEDIRSVTAPKLFMVSKYDFENLQPAHLFEERSPEPRTLHSFLFYGKGTELVNGDRASEVREVILTFLRTYR